MGCSLTDGGTVSSGCPVVNAKSVELHEPCPLGHVRRYSDISGNITSSLLLQSDWTKRMETRFLGEELDVLATLRGIGMRFLA